jgi:peptidoglycan/xylan/chitin deacetylase (PgdA/CDA1 family)
MEVFDRLGIRCTVSLSMAVLEMYPEIAQAMMDRQWEFMCHGLYNTRYHWNLSEDEERAEIAHCQAIHRRVTGRDFGGWFSPAASNTLHTPDLVAEAGIRYFCDLYHDDQPTWVRVRGGLSSTSPEVRAAADPAPREPRAGQHGLISLPYSMEVNDSICWRRGMEGETFAQKILDEFETLYAEGGRVMCVAVHPFIMGQPHRIAHLERALTEVLKHPGVWCATGEEIVSAWLAQQAAHAA